MRNKVQTVLSASTNTTSGSVYIGNMSKGSVQIDITGTITCAINLSVDGVLWEPVTVGGASSWAADTNIDIDFYGKNYINAVTTGVSGGSVVVTLSAKGD